MKKAYKHQYLDKFDSYMPNKTHWVHNEYHISRESESFHLSSGFSTEEESSTSFGVSKKEHKTSSCGYEMDSQYVGKSENS